MKNSILLIIGITLIFAILIPINFESLYNYSTYIVPIKNVILLESEPIAHIDAVKLETNRASPIPLKNFTINDDNTLTVSFHGGADPNGFNPTIPDFDYNSTFQINQTFAFRCLVLEENTFLGFYKYLGTQIIHDEKYILLWHYEGETQNLMPCDYPQIIANSIDLIDDHPTENDMKFFYKSMGLKN